MAAELTVAIGGLGAIGAHLARALDAGVQGLRLVAVAARDQEKAKRTLAGFRTPPALVTLPELGERADIVVEAAPAAVFEQIAESAIARGRGLFRVGAPYPRCRAWIPSLSTSRDRRPTCISPPRHSSPRAWNLRRHERSTARSCHDACTRVADPPRLD